MTVRDSITRARARTPGAEATPPPRRCTNEPSSRHSAGLPRAPRSAQKADTNHHQPVYAGSRLKPADVREGAALHASPPAVSGKTRRTEGEGGSRKARHHPRPGPRLDSTRLRGSG